MNKQSTDTSSLLSSSNYRSDIVPDYTAPPTSPPPSAPQPHMQQVQANYQSGPYSPHQQPPMHMQQPPMQYGVQPMMPQQPQVAFIPQAVTLAAPSFFSAFSMMNANGQLGVYTDKPYYVSGELITGRVMANVLQPISCRSVCVQVLGYEKSEWHELRHESRQHGNQRYTRKVLYRFRGKRNFFNVTIRVNNLNNGILNPGQYIFPFQYQLPDQLPGSFYERRDFKEVLLVHDYVDDNTYGNDFCDSDDDVDENGNLVRVHTLRRPDYRRPELLAIVNYKLRAVLDVNGVFSPNLRATAPIVIHPRLAQQVRPAAAKIAKDVMVCCCINKGRCELDAHFDKNSYVPGEVAMIVSDVNNQSKKPLVMVVKLWRTLEVRSGHSSHRKVETTLAIEQRYEGINPFDKKVQNMPMPLPSMLKPTTGGEFVKCSYNYTVECQVSWGGDIKIQMPVTIYAPQPPSTSFLKPLF
jgi:hypothetical protein